MKKCIHFNCSGGVLKNVYTCGSNTTIKTQNIITKGSLVLPPISPHLTVPPQVTTDLLSINIMGFVFSRVACKGNLFSLRIMFLRLSMFLCAPVVCSFLLLCSIHCMNKLQFVSPFTKCWTSDCFKISAIMNKSAMDIYVQVFVYIYIYIFILCSRIAESYVRYIFNFIRNLYCVAFYSKRLQVSFAPQSLQHLVLSVFFFKFQLFQQV